MAELAELKQQHPQLLLIRLNQHICKDAAVERGGQRLALHAVVSTSIVAVFFNNFRMLLDASPDQKPSLEYGETEI